jgi:hypothetical protein
MENASTHHVWSLQLHIPIGTNFQNGMKKSRMKLTENSKKEKKSGTKLKWNHFLIGTSFKN